MKQITSRNNAEIKKIYTLQQKKYREQHQQYIAEGLRVITTLLEHKQVCIQLYTTTEQLAHAQRIYPIEHITLVSDEVMQKISTMHSPPGLLGVFVLPTRITTPSHLASGIVLANIQDPGNMGTLIRTAAALAITNIVLIDGVDPWSPKVIHASAGTVGSVSLIHCSWHELTAITDRPQLAALVVKDGVSPATITDHNLLLVIGNEAHGIPHTWLSDCNLNVTLPMPGNTESLNAAIAGAIIMYQLFSPQQSKNFPEL